jgi:hypothetical protein
MSYLPGGNPEPLGTSPWGGGGGGFIVHRYREPKLSRVTVFRAPGLKVSPAILYF